MKRRNLAALTAAATAFAVVPAIGSAQAAEGGKAVLHNSGVQRNVSGHRFAMQQDASSTTSMQLSLQLPVRNANEAMSLMAKGVTMTPAQYDAKFGTPKAQMDKVVNWAKSQGFTIAQVSPGTGTVVVRANAGQVNKAFSVKMKKASLDGRSGLAVDRDPSVPSSLGLSGVSGLNQLRPAHTNHVASPFVSTSNVFKRKHIARPLANGDGDYGCVDYWGQHLGSKVKKYTNESNPLCGYKPQQLQGVYGAKNYSSKAPVLGIVLWGNDTNALANANKNMAAAGFPQLPQSKYKASSATPNSSMKDCDQDPGEQNLDIQASHAIAPSASIQYYGAASCYPADTAAALLSMVNAHQVTTISMSFGTPDEVGMTAADAAAYDRPLEKAGLTGISTFASTGDDNDGSPISRTHKPAVGWPAASAYLTAVGGTSVGIGSTNGVSALAAWENSYYTQQSNTVGNWKDITAQEGYEGGGGGVSTLEPQPLWQKGVVGSYTKRAIPDMSAIANNMTGYSIYYSGGFHTIGGTSLASPVTAALVGLAKASNNVKIGNAAPYFYKMRNSSAITDVNSRNGVGMVGETTSGELLVIGFDDKPLTLVSGKGWDNATGVGTPSASFIPNFK